MNILSDLRYQSGDTEYAAGVVLYRKTGVNETRRVRGSAEYIIAGTPRYSVKLFPDASAVCSCGIAYCRHVVAAFLAAVESGMFSDIVRARTFAAAPALLAAMESALPEAGELKLQPSLFVEDESIRIGLRIGEDRLYAVRSISQFLSCMGSGESLVFGKGFTYQPHWMCFSEKQKELLSVLQEYFEIVNSRETLAAGVDTKKILLPAKTSARVLNAIKDMTFRLTIKNETFLQEGIIEKAIPVSYLLSGSPRSLSVIAELPENLRPLTPDCSYIVTDEKVFHIPHVQRTAIKTLLRFRNGNKAAFAFSADDTQRVLNELIPYLVRTGSLRIESELEKQMQRMPFRARLYLDRGGTDITARTVFCYGQYEIDPFASEIGKEMPFILRDSIGEQSVMDELAGAGFHVKKGRVYLSGHDNIYHFITEGVSHLIRHAEVFFSKEFQYLTPRKPSLKGSLSISDGELKLELFDDGAPIEDLLPLMQALRDRRFYFRYKDGTFISLEGMEQWISLADAICEASEQNGKSRDLGAFRSAYLHALINLARLPIQVDAGADRLSAMAEEVPPVPFEGLRTYQIRGFRWLCMLHSLSMGGIMADDMGLGKTVQTIAALLSIHKAAQTHKPSLIITPTSLIYNWLAEFKRFAPELKVLMATGGHHIRVEQIRMLIAEDNPDIYITSYPLIRRDIQMLENIPFRMAVLDEAQFIKNAASVGAHAVKRIIAETRVALTGTPMENHAGELWSLFDFVLPGYLPRAQEFMRRYGDGQNSEDLLMRVRPFLMRRLKKEVLSELPDKLESTMMADMPIEQRRVYNASLMQKRRRVAEILNEKGMSHGRAEVLSAITELRQICCHPILCLPDYTGSSCKMEMLMDVLQPALESEHRILVFSQFTRMLRLIEGRLAAESIRSLYLDGETPASHRQVLADRFNAGEGDVFLISLKAGGTGLNLTGADMVIHYDPWWNPTAEDQAIDRAHRIGQTHIVEVVRLIVHNSIEEQVVSMGKRKRQLFDRLITPGEAMPLRLSDSDILSLFDEEHI